MQGINQHALPRSIETYVCVNQISLMQSPVTRAALEHCCTVVADAEIEDELRVLAWSLLDHLLELHDGNRMRASVLLAALDSLALVPGLESHVAKLRAAAALDKPGLYSDRDAEP